MIPPPPQSRVFILPSRLTAPAARSLRSVLQVAAELARRREAALELEQAAVARARAIVQERARALAAKVAKVDAHEAMLRANFGGAILAGMLSLVYMGELEKEDAAALAGAAAAGSDPEFRAEIERRKQLLLVVTEGGGGGQQQ